MNLAVTGTPGTGKTTAVEHLDTDLDVIHLNEVIHEEGLIAETDDQRDTAVADIEAVSEWLEGRGDRLVESHLAHQFDADRVVVLRCEPETIERRLTERGESAATAAENAESEALDVILSEAVAEHGTENVYEIVTTERDPAGVAAEIAAVIEGTRDPSAGTVDYTGYL